MAYLPIPIRHPALGEGRLWLGPIPGRGGDLAADLADLRLAGVGAILTLNPAEELGWLGLARLPEQARALGFAHLHQPVADYDVLDLPDPRPVLRWMEARLEDGLFVHCRAGIGRAGMMCAALLAWRGATPEDAVLTVRGARPGAMETARQEAFVRRVHQGAR